MAENTQLRQIIAGDEIFLEDIAEKTGYSLGYLVNVLQGRVPFSDALKFQIVSAFPETAAFLLNGGTPQPAADALALRAGSGADHD